MWDYPTTIDGWINLFFSRVTELLDFLTTLFGLSL